jgi:hypothetical protein
MAKLEARPKIELEIVMRLNEAEARFLEGLSGFDHKTLLEGIRKIVGVHYTELKAPDGYDGSGFLSLMEACRRDLPPALDRMKAARDVFENRVKAVKVDAA